MNIVLADSEEFRRVKKGKEKAREEKRILGLIILRGEVIVSMSAEAPPPAARGRQVAVATSGLGKAAGRGLPMSEAALAGLAGPVHGVGGPAHGLMQPGARPHGMPP
ncbi:hypothetical protein H696_06351, partial [Fonticula alba]